MEYPKTVAAGQPHQPAMAASGSDTRLSQSKTAQGMRSFHLIFCASQSPWPRTWGSCDCRSPQTHAAHNRGSIQEQGAGPSGQRDHSEPKVRLRAGSNAPTEAEGPGRPLVARPGFSSARQGGGQSGELRRRRRPEVEHCRCLILGGQRDPRLGTPRRLGSRLRIAGVVVFTAGHTDSQEQTG